MQILQWLFKLTPEEQTNKNAVVTEELVLFKGHGASKRFSNVEQNDCSESESFTILLGRGNVPRACFNSTLNLKRLGSFCKGQHHLQPLRMKEGLGLGLGKGHKADTAGHVGNKVLPICDASTSASTIIATNDPCGSSEKKDKLNGDKTRTISRMKELLRWAATAKSEKGGKYIRRKVLYFRNRGSMKASPHDDDQSSSSPKISFQWDVGSCSTSSSAYSALSLASSTRNDRKWTKPSSNSKADKVSASDQGTKETTLTRRDSDECSSGTGKWITTDAEFVVLEL